MKKAMLELVPYVKVAELAARLNITKQALWGLVKRGVITPPIKFGHRTHVWHVDTAEQIIRTRQSKLLAIYLKGIEITRRDLGKLRRFIKFVTKYKLYDTLRHRSYDELSIELLLLMICDLERGIQNWL